MAARIYNKLNTALFQNTVCTPFYIVPEQCSKCSRTVNGAACRVNCKLLLVNLAKIQYTRNGEGQIYE